MEQGAAEKRVRQVRRARRVRRGASEAPSGSAPKTLPPSERSEPVRRAPAAAKMPPIAHAERKRQQAEQRKREQGAKKIQTKIADLEARIAEREQAMKEIEAAMSAPGFYDNRDQAQPLIDRHQTLMWELGDLMHQWEELQKADRSRRCSLQNCPATDDNVISGCQSATRTLTIQGFRRILAAAAGHGVCPFGALILRWKTRIRPVAVRRTPDAIQDPSRTRQAGRAPARRRNTRGESDRFFRRLVGSMRNGVLAITRDGNVAEMNAEAARIFQIKRSPRSSAATSPKCSPSTPTWCACCTARSS